MKPLEILIGIGLMLVVILIIASGPLSNLYGFVSEKIVGIRGNQSEVIGERVFSEEVSEIFAVENLVDTNYDIRVNIRKMPDDVRETYYRLLDLKIEEVNKNAFDYLVGVSQEKGLNPLLPFLVLTQESRGNPNAISHTGCVGLFQFCYSTAYGGGFKDIFGTEGTKCENRDITTCRDDARFDPKKSIDAGVRYLASLTERYKNIHLILTAYNAGGAISDQCVSAREDVMQTCLIDETKEYYESKNIQNKEEEVEGYLNIIESNFVAMYS